MLSHTYLQENIAVNLIPFFANKVETELVWSRLDTNETTKIKESCSYLIEPESSTQGRVFLAERYGGSGIQRNGGGARCGIYGQYQVKGIGANPLVGEGTGWQHSSGALGVSEAIYEAIWGEILDDVLPFGAVKAQAVLLTNRNMQNPSEEDGNTIRRALIVRHPVIRPAHFERAPYFRPQTEFSGQLMHDARRVRSVIHQLSSCLPQPFGGFSAEGLTNPQIRCIEGLCELARRLAWQMAYCRTRFLKMTTSPSNVAIDGRLLDFNGVGCLFPSDHFLDFSYQLRLQEMMKEPMILRKGLSGLCLYLGKYLFGTDFTTSSSQQVQRVFEQTFEKACHHGYLTLLGINAYKGASIKALPKDLKNLVDSFLQLLANLRRDLHCLTAENQSHSLLERLVLQLYQQVDDAEFQKNIHYQKLRNCLQAARPLLKQKDSELADQGLLRLQSRTSLGKLQMFSEIKQLLELHSHDAISLQHAVEAMVAEKQAFARTAFGRDVIKR